MVRNSTRMTGPRKTTAGVQPRDRVRPARMHQGLAPDGVIVVWSKRTTREFVRLCAAKTKLVGGTT